MQGYNYYTRLQLLYKATTTLQGYSYYTRLQLLYKATATIQGYDYSTRLRLYSTRLLQLEFHPWEGIHILRNLYFRPRGGPQDF